ncbi:probable chitinase 10 [Ctenocephalides felis]|uniref:probable chitinase 10 n=1 Tax=Ctenocephalides felis TaxID=7515 RepID=UPI000E6E1D94|nr:probable chitinase 10 [Ctenocephalides felis]
MLVLFHKVLILLYSSDADPMLRTKGNDFKVICYFTNWAWYRQRDGKYTPDNIDASLCTHIVYGFATLDSSTLTMKPFDTWADLDNKFYEKVVSLKAKGVKVSIAIGGWNDSQGDKYSRLVNNADARRRFITNAVEFLKKYQFDGLDLDWEYPACWQGNCKGSNPSDKQGFTAFVKELSAALKPQGFLLSSAVSPSKKIIDAAYDVSEIASYLDWIGIMSYDYHGQWDGKTGHIAPLLPYPGDQYDYFNVDYTVRYWIKKGAPPEKLIMGIPTYGQSFTLSNPSNNGINAPSNGGGQPGEYTKTAGFLAFYEICENVHKNGWKVVRDPEGRIGPYAYKNNQWVSYDDVDEVKRKSALIRELGLGGGMIWALDLDDFRNNCGCGKNPLLSTLSEEMLRSKISNTKNCT